MLDLTPEIDELWEELNEAIQGVLRSGRFILGPNVAAFEGEVASYLGVKHAIGVNSGTDALTIGLRALGVGPGDQVITTCFSFFATPGSISNVGATPVFADIDPESYNLDPELIETGITGRTRAILPVHLFGQAADMERICAVAERHGIPILEDVAQAFGASHGGSRLGAIGGAGIFSFFPAKSLGAFGDAGMIATDSDEVAEKARMLRNHGSRQKYVNEMIGYNSRLDELQAAILRVRFPRLDANNRRRVKIAELYSELLAGVPYLTTPVVKTYGDHVFNYYTLRIADGRRDGVEKALEAAGIASAIYYPIPLHRLPPYEDRSVQLPVAERAAGEVLSLPMGPELTEARVRLIAETVRSALR
jgi:dTDP-4-amino-4,6-dideoxygalactose transaminase